MNQLARIENRRRVGGIVDRRFGENDPTMAPEDKMLGRFTQEKQSRHKNAIFDLEDANETELTHMGQSLSLNAPPAVDDFDEDLELSDTEDHLSDQEEVSRKRRRLSDDEGPEDEEDEEEEDLPERKKSKQEVMKEVIAKSKLHKYERQAAKDDDDDLREALDKETSSIHALLQGMGKRNTPAPASDSVRMNPDRAALLNGTDKLQVEKEYGKRLRELAQDGRAKPTERTRTEQDILEQKAKLRKEREDKSHRRMQGLPENSDEDDIDDKGSDQQEEDDEGTNPFGLGIPIQKAKSELGVEDEDDFLIDDDLVASDSGLDLLEDDSQDDESEEGGDRDEDADAEFLQGILTEDESNLPEFLTGANSRLPFMSKEFKCPESHDELLEITKDVDDLPEFIKLIRTKYDPKLSAENKTKLGNFAVSLIDHISYLANETAPFPVLESIIRHIHSLAKNQDPVEISNRFLRWVKEIHECRPLSLTAGDLVLLTAIGTIFPTSDHFHQVVTPAILTISRYLGLKISQNLSDYAVGTYLCTLCLQYQRQSKRYIPEAMNFIENTLCVLAPLELSKLPGNFPYHEPKSPLRIEKSVESVRRFAFTDCLPQELSEDQDSELKVVLLETNLKLLEVAADTWFGKSAFFEVFEPSLKIVQHLAGKHCKPKLSRSTQVTNRPFRYRPLLTIIQTAVTKLISKLNLLLQQAQLSRRPLELHHHRPLAIKMAIPKFEESYNPDRHYDPNRDRSEASKLKKELKRERKGAIRDLRKDAKAVARETLKQKKAKDEAYEKKYKRLVAEIQGEEGKEAKAYEREKEWRKKGRK
jgi:nucleolar protein 14